MVAPNRSERKARCGLGIEINRRSSLIDVKVRIPEQPSETVDRL